MGEIVNLRRARKRKAREAAAAEADANRTLHGVPKHTQKSAKAQTAREKHNLDGQRLDPEGSN